MRLIVGLLAFLLAISSAPARAQDSASAFTVGGIDLDVAAKSTEEARTAAFREAQRRGWRQLWARMTGNPVADAPKMSDSALDAMVAGIEIEAERFSETRYIARLGVVFDRVRAGRFLGETAEVLRSPPMLLLPVLIDGGTRTVYESRSPWLQAWTRFRSAASPIEYVRAPGVSGDAILLNAYQARRDNRNLWRVILNRFQTADVLTAEAKLDRSYPGGPVVGTFTARHGPDAELVARFKLRAASSGEVDQMLDEAVRRVDAAYATALREGRLKSDPGLTADLAPIASAAPEIAVTVPESGIELLVATPDAASWAAIESTIRATPTVTGVSIVSLSLGGNSRIRIGHNDNYDWLRYNLDQRGWRLEPVEGGLWLRRRTPSDPPIARPLTLEELNAAMAGDEGATAAARPAAPTPPTAPPPQNGGPANLLPDVPTQ